MQKAKRRILMRNQIPMNPIGVPMKTKTTRTVDWMTLFVLPDAMRSAITQQT